MRKFLFANSSLLTLLAAGPGLAADLPKMPVKAPPVVPAPYYSWTSCYIGGHLGGGWGRKIISDVPPNAILVGNGITPGSVRVATRGFLGGGQIGCDYEFSSHWVIGIEGAASAANISGKFYPAQSASLSFGATTRSIETVTGRVGYAFDRVLPYVKGGAAWARDMYNATDYLGAYYTASETRSGWTLGGGLEWALANDWSAKLEYDYYDFGSRNLDFLATTANSFVTSSHEFVNQRIQTVMFGINYHFRTDGTSAVTK
jgi:outer membrane immunogenic protein